MAMFPLFKRIPNSMYNPNVILFNNRLNINTFLNTGKNMQSYPTKIITMDGPVGLLMNESLLSDSKMMEVEMMVKN